MLLGLVAQKLGLELRGNPDTEITHADTLEDAGSGAITFLSNSKYRRYLSSTGASAVIMESKFAEGCAADVIISDNPYLAFARVLQMLHPSRSITAGVHASAVIDETASVSPLAWIGPNAVIGAGSIIGDNTSVGPGCVVGEHCRIGEGSRLVSNVSICDDVVIGNNALVHPGVVIGADGFGMANDAGRWVKIPQIGRVVIGNDVEIGANTTIDRGALKDTVIADGVKIDNLIMIAHNVSIGAHTAIAACTGISGSTKIGKHCTLGGGAGLAGHIELGDNVHVTGMAMVTRSLPDPGVYSGNMPVTTNRDWRRNIANFRRMDKLLDRVKQLEDSVFDRDDEI